VQPQIYTVNRCSCSDRLVAVADLTNAEHQALLSFRATLCCVHNLPRTLLGTGAFHITMGCEKSTP